MKKRPPSSRQVHQNFFSPYISSKRLRNVQDVLKSSDEDAVLCILGIDSLYNEGCRELANYLLFNFYSLCLPELERCGLSEEDVDDVVILVRRGSVAVYCCPGVLPHLMPFIAHWQNLNVYCLPEQEDEEEDQDAAEEFKIRSFVAMVAGCRKIGIPYHASRSYQRHSHRDSSFDKFAIEKWALIQSYALEEYGGGGFFTMCFEVSDIRSKLLLIYSECDPASAEEMLIRSLPLFERHWREAVNVISGVSGDGDIRSYVALPHVTEAQVAEPIRSYFRHGRLSNHSVVLLANGDSHLSVADDALDGSVTPYVRFGVRTSDKAPSAQSKVATLGDSGADGHALHFVIHSSAPKSPISCSRTYFVRPGDSDKKLSDFDQLVAIYSSCVGACTKAIEAYASTGNRSFAKKAAADVLEKRLAADSKDHVTASYRADLVYVDNAGNLVSDQDQECYHNVKRFTVEVLNVKSKADGSLLGNVCYSDSFIDSRIITESPEGSGLQDERDNASRSLASGQSYNFLVLSSGVARYAVWQFDKEPTPDACDVIGTLENVIVAFEGPISEATKQNNVQVLQDASLLVSPLRSPPQKIASDRIEKIAYYQSPQDHEVAVMSVRLKEKGRDLAVMLFPNTSSKKLFNKKIKRFLEDSTIEFESVYVPEPWTDCHHKWAQRLYEWHLRGASSGKRFGSESWSEKLSRSAQSLQPELGDFMSHFAVSSAVRGSTVPSSDLPFLLNGVNDFGEAQPAKVNTDSKVCVTIVVGHPGSHADQLSASLVSLHKERVRWVTVRTPALANDACSVDVDQFQKSLAEAVVKRRAARPGAAATKRLRIIVEVIGFFDLSTVVYCITNHPSPTTRGAIYIGAVTTCVEPLNSEMENRMLLPNMAEQCKAGLVNSIAFTGSTEDLKDKNLASMKSHLRMVNPDAAFLLAEQGKTSRSGDFDLILSETAFNAAEYVKARHLSVPSLWKGAFDPGRPFVNFNVVKLAFSQPLLRATFSARLRALRHALAASPYKGNIYTVKGVVAFTDSMPTANDVTFVTQTGQMTFDPRPSQSDSMVPAPPPSKGGRSVKLYSLEFYGVALDEARLRDWLRKCGHQRATKKSHRTRATLSAAEVKSIQMQHSTDPLPEGVFFNGTQYCSLLDNARSYQHPYLEKFIEKYLEEENRKVDEFNRKLGLESVADMFD